MRNPLLCSFAQWAKGVSICLFVPFLFAATVAAQTQITTGAIQGTVQDANGAAVPTAAERRADRTRTVGKPPFRKRDVISSAGEV